MEFGRRADPRKKLTGISLVVLLHLIMVWALINGLARKAIELLPAPLETQIFEDTRAQDEPPPPPPPVLDTPPPDFVPPVEVNIQHSEEPRPNAITVSEAPPEPAPVAAEPVVVARTKPVVKASNCREPEYPALSERLGEAGAVMLSLLVGVDGKVIDRRVVKSSGFERLDTAALEGLSQCLFQPGTVNGVPEPSWASIRYDFKRRG